jgi:shikimate kinase
MRRFMAVEDRTLRALRTRRCVIAPGGSAVYYPRGMAALKRLGPVVYLRVSLAELKKRLPDWSSRGVVCRGGTSLSALFRERSPLYRRYADVTVDANGRNWDKMASAALKGAAGWHAKAPGRKTRKAGN